MTVIILCGFSLPLCFANGACLDVHCCWCLFLRYNRRVRLSSEFRDGDRHLCQPLVHHTLGVATIRTLHNPHRTKNKTQEKQETKDKTNGSVVGYKRSWLCVYEIPMWLVLKHLKLSCIVLSDESSYNSKRKENNIKTTVTLI